MKLRLLCLFIVIQIFAFGQSSSTLEKYNAHFEQAETYKKVSLYAESIEEINHALKIARRYNWKEKNIKATIFLAELMRQTKDFKKGIKVLRELSYSSEYPQLHVEKLGRMAALFHETTHLPDYQKFDSVEFYLKKALSLAEKFDFRREKAGLYNELGYRIGHKDVDSCLFLLGEASRIFIEEKDTQNYIVARTNMLRTYVTIKDSARMMSTFNELDGLVKGRDWHILKREVYSTMLAYYVKKGDSLNANYWRLKWTQVELANTKNISSVGLNSFRAIYETKKYQEEVKKKNDQLRKETRRRNEIIVYLGVLSLLSLGISLLLFRERKLKRKITEANDDYEMLLIESNHRIKNNLQMIISMLQYASQGLKKENSIALERMSTKIQTISALHKHLYMDVHNEQVELKGYFASIIELYQSILAQTFHIELDIDHVEIRSERIVYFGLIFNEMLTNTIEHRDSKENKLLVSVKLAGDYYHFSYQDDSAFDENGEAGTGTVLIQQLVNRVKGTNFQVQRDLGKYEFDFRV